MELVPLDIEGLHLRVADLDTLRIVACIQLTSDRQASCGRGGRDYSPVGILGYALS